MNTKYTKALLQNIMSISDTFILNSAFCQTVCSILQYFVRVIVRKEPIIATQGPLPITVNDFWRMMWEQQCRCIVMLCKTEENEQVK